MPIDMVGLAKIAGEVSDKTGEEVLDIAASIGIRNEPCPPEVAAERHQMVRAIKQRRSPTK